MAKIITNDRKKERTEQTKVVCGYER